MARIRSIKPEFFTDEKLIECSTSARLLFVGVLVFADDEGNLDRSAKQLKVQVFPADNIDCEPLLQELMARELLVEYSSSGKNYLHVKSFKKHQKIDRPSKPRFPLYEESLRTQRPLVEDSLPEGKGREEERKGIPPSPPSGGSHVSPDKDTTTENTSNTRELRFHAKQILAYLNRTAGKGFHEVESNLEPIVARLKEGATPTQCKSVIVDRWQAWSTDEDMHEYLRPETLFRRSKFWSYLGNITSGASSGPESQRGVESTREGDGDGDTESES